MPRINEKNVGIAVARLERVIEIMKLLVQQISIMQTMTPLDFLDFIQHNLAVFEYDWILV